jgi:predicted RNA binding protein YcfA (HicA-like mRNA interferase family)
VRIKPTHYTLQVRIFEKAGCIYSRTKGDHLIYHFPGAIRPVVIPKYKEVPTFVIKNNMRIIGMDRELYFELFDIVE